MSPEGSDRESRDDFLRKLKVDWASLWRERYDDRVRAEGVSVKDYPHIFMERGAIIFASRSAKAASFSEVVDFWAAKGCVYAPNPAVGGWGKFIRTELSKHPHSRAKMLNGDQPKPKVEKQQRKKGGRGWLHT